MPPDPRRCCFISDLHLFTHRSRAAAHREALRRAWEQSELLILGGDIFDFDWANLSDLENTLDAAERWLERRLEERSGRPMRFIAGNHDCHRPFWPRLDRLAADHPQFAWDSRLFRMGRQVFVHGDLVHAPPGDLEAFEVMRQGRWDNRPKGLLARLLYNGLIACYGHLAVHYLSFPPRRTTERLLVHLTAMGHGPEDGVREIFFGHTHLRLDGFQHGGCRFYNCGAPIKGLAFEPVWFDR